MRAVEGNCREEISDRMVLPVKHFAYTYFYLIPIFHLHALSPTICPRTP